MIELRHLRAFIAVAEELNYHRAAERLHVVQPALSRTIKDLERAMGATLFDRGTRHVRLTEAGKTLYGEALGLIGRLSAAVENTRRSAEGARGLVRLAYMDFAVHRILPRMLKTLAAAEPGISAELVYMSTAAQRLALIEGRIDAGVMIGAAAGLGIESRIVSEEPIVIGLSTGHRFAARRQVRVSEILAEPILLGSAAEWSAFRDTVFALFAEAGASPRIAHEASSAGALLGLAAEGLGLMPYAGVPRLYQAKALVFPRLAGVAPLAIGLAWRKTARDTPLGRFLAAAGI